MALRWQRMAFLRPQPPLVRQSSRERCWAAVFESLSRITPAMGGAFTQAQLVQAPWIAPYLNRNDGLDMNEGWRRLTAHYNMHRVTQAPRTIQIAGFDAVLRFSYIVTAYAVQDHGRPASHLVLAYGTTATELLVMDPFRGYIAANLQNEVFPSTLRLAWFPAP